MMPQPDRALLSSAGVGPAALDRLASVADDVACRLSARPRRLEHSMGVARTCAWIASQHGVDPALAYAVGLLHDWEKARGHEEQLRRAEELGLDFGVPLRQVLPLLHGPIAARDLPARYPWLPPEAWHAIAVHTTACEDMSDLDMALFVADGVEPQRPASPGIEQVRGLLADGAPLREAFLASFVNGVAYVLEGRRYLYPGTVAVYNALVSGA